MHDVKPLLVLYRTLTNLEDDRIGALFTQFLRFCFVGVFATAIHFTTLILLVQALRVDAVAASTTGFLIAAVSNYLLNHRYTFASKRRHREAVIRFFAVALAGLALNGFMMFVCVDALDMPYLLAQVLTTGLVLLWNFSANRRWTFC